MSVKVTPAQMETLRATLLNTSGKVQLHERFRALFMLKAVGGDDVVNIISEGETWPSLNSCVEVLMPCRIGLEDPSPLLKHELAYVLGQLSNNTAIPTLEAVLVNADGKHCSMVRHEAAEALGALSSESSLPLLRKYLDDESREVRETCEIAVGKIEFDISEEGKKRVPK